jgi:hypothetical protein
MKYTEGKAQSFIADEFSTKRNVLRAKELFMDCMHFVRETTIK